MRLHLTDLAVRGLKPDGHNTIYWDTQTRGFGIQVGKKWKTWKVMRGDHRERISIGRYGELTLSEARAEAKKILATAPAEKPTSISFNEAKKEFLSQNYRDRALRTLFEATRQLNKHFRALHDRPLEMITDADIKKQLDKIAAPSARLHAYRQVRCFLRWCTRPPRKYIKHSPMEGYEPPGKDRRRTRILTDAELKAVWKVTEKPPYTIFRILILWGTRSTETTRLRRNFICDDVLTIPGENTKNGRPHAIPLEPVAQKVLDSVPNLGPYYFVARWDDTGYLSSGAWSKLKREVQKASGTTDWQIRDIRRTFRSNMRRLKVPRDICELLINHAPPVLDEIYDRYDYLDEKREALAKYEAFLNKLVETD